MQLSIYRYTSPPVHHCILVSIHSILYYVVSVSNYVSICTYIFRNGSIKVYIAASMCPSPYLPVYLCLAIDQRLPMYLSVCLYIHLLDNVFVAFHIWTGAELQIQTLQLVRKMPGNVREHAIRGICAGNINLKRS